MPTALDNGQRRLIPRWRKATWTLLVFTVVMALGATVSATAVTAKESVSAADMRDCTAAFLFEPGPTWEQCDDRLHNGDTVITAFIVSPSISPSLLGACESLSGQNDCEDAGHRLWFRHWR